MSFRKHIESTPHRCLIVITPYELLEFVVVVVFCCFFCFFFLCVCVVVVVFWGGGGGGGRLFSQDFFTLFLNFLYSGIFFLSLPLFPYVFVKPWW